ncbi:MAG: sulfite exporter TauE/SafE family protein [Ignavibacteriae bacterium]|nr:sulfite exporter TauE/SafE family protein [Ignavibacteria bacterium]MBI3364109.1 sulfite exporter TauE/SafE family protein [Ignavibacteriota bacterium]
MEFPLISVLLICGLFFLVALLYSSVGHGGASGYLAVMSLFAMTPKEMASTALILNILVAGISLIAYIRAGHFSFRLSLPFLILSIPLAFIGGMSHVSTTIYVVLLTIALVAAAVRLIVQFEQLSGLKNYSAPAPIAAVPVGGAIGFISGVVGVGGGIFLSPLMLLLRWADPKKTAATSAFFIVANSCAGIAGRISQGNFSATTSLPFLIAAVVGGLLGARWGATRFSNLTLRRLLGLALMIAAVKLLLSVF